MISKRVTYASNYTISNSFFNTISSNENGGSVFIDCTSVSFRAEYSTFVSCRSEGTGGSIHANVKESSNYAICCKSGYSKSPGSYAHCTCVDPNTNTIEFLSMNDCTCDSSYISVIKNGLQKGNFINSTRNKNPHAAGYFFYFSTQGSISSYCSLNNNTSNDGSILEFSDDKIDIKNHNVIYNSALNKEIGILSSWRATGTLSYCAFLGNKNFGYMIYSDESTINIENSYLQSKETRGDGITISE